MLKAFTETHQRPFPLPSFPWIATQRWDYMLFAHWPVPAHFLAEYIPPAFEVDLFQNKAWLSFVPFFARNTRLRGFPRFPFYHSYLELNLRTYVTYKGVPGIYLLSLDANKWPVVSGAKIASFLPYYHAKINLRIQEKKIHFNAKRSDPGKPAKTFEAVYQPFSPIFMPEKGSVDWWLLERYCFWLQKGHSIYRGDIHHSRWRAARAECSIKNNTMASFLPCDVFSGQPLFHFSHKKNVFIWPLKKVR